MRSSIFVLILCVIVAVALGCGGDAPNNVSDGSGSGGSPGGVLFDLDPSEAACMIADAAMVTAAFEGTAAAGEPGPARNCSFGMTDGEVEQVDVFFFGPAANWDGLRQGFEDNRGGTTDFAGIGEEAFYPNDQGPRELVVRAGGVIFAVTVFVFLADPPPSAIADVATLAMAIANHL